MAQEEPEYLWFLLVAAPQEAQGILGLLQEIRMLAEVMPVIIHRLVLVAVVVAVEPQVIRLEMVGTEQRIQVVVAEVVDGQLQVRHMQL